MKKTTVTCTRISPFLAGKYFIQLLFIFITSLSYAQPNTWAAKQDFGGTARNLAAGFTIGTKVYIGTGTDAGFIGKKDFWEYDPAGNTWTQKADFAGLGRYGAVGFSINGKGYIGLGAGDMSATLFTDIWEYDPTGNTWTQKTDFPGAARLGAVAFVVNNKAYVGTGQNSSADALKDVWEFDPAGNSWTAKATFPGTGRYFAAGFAIGTKGYLGTGTDVNDNSLGDFWEYDPSGNAWTQKANVGTGTRTAAVGFAISTRGFIATGFASTLDDMWEYNPNTNIWTQKANFAASGRFGTVGVAVGGKAYIGTGRNGVDTRSFSEYTPSPILLDQTITFNTLAGKTFGDAAFGLTATASSSLGVSYISSNTAVATISGSTVTIVGAGTTTITASQAGNGTYDPAPSVDRTLTVAKANQTVIFNTLAGKTFGDAAFGLTATASSSLSVSYISSNTAVATISGSTVTIVGVGSTTITASQAGNGNYNAATSIDQTLSIAKANQTITFGALATKTFGNAAFALLATASSALTVSYASSNTAVATISGATVTIVGAGSTTITASQAGNGNYNAAPSVDQSLTVAKANQTITFNALPIKKYGDADFALTATSTSGLEIVYGTSNSSIAIITGNMLSIKMPGVVTITAQQSGNANYNAAASQQRDLTVGLGTQIITFNALEDKSTLSSPYALSATSSSALPVSFSSSNTAVATVAGNQVTIVAAGTTTIRATQSGNSFYSAASAVDRVLTVKPGQTITFAALPAKVIGDAAFTVSATATSGLPVTFASSNPAIATVSGSTVTINGIGTAAIIASQAGDATFFKASDVNRLLVVKNIIQTANEQGQLWGMIADGGDGNLGLIYKTNGDGTGYALAKEFKADANGAFPNGTLTLASNGKFYGITYEGGLHNGGVLFEFDPATSAYTKKFDFSAFAYPVQELAANANGKLYGMVQQGLLDITEQVIFEYDIATNSFTKKLKITSDIGRAPAGKLMLTNGKIYGLLNQGGVNSKGSIFEYDAAANTIVKRADFAGTDGASPVDFTLRPDGKLYGTTSSGGLNNNGVIFEFDPATGSITKRFDFASATSGASPRGLMNATNGKLYGMTSAGGASGVGTIFEFDPATIQFTKKYDFISIIGDTQGYPSGRLLEAPNGKLYGADTGGGGTGTLFEFDVANTTFTKKIFFSDAIGSSMFGSLYLSNNKMYGLTSRGGSANAGVLFEYDFATNDYVKKHEFTYAPDGVKPQGGVTLASNGKLYGVTRQGGASNDGVIFEIDPATDTYTKRADFNKATSGADPAAALHLGINGKLYGAAKQGTSGSSGGLFEFDPATNTIQNLSAFGITNGLTMIGKLTQTEDGKLWGVTSAGGTSFPNSGGVLFEFDHISKTTVKKNDFTTTTGTEPLGGLTLASNGKFYGLTSKGGSNDAGTLFEYDRTSNTFTKKYDFATSSGTKPHATLTEVNAKLYGMTHEGGANNVGVLFEYDPATGTYTRKYDFNSPTGSNPKGSLLLAANGKLYGTTLYGGAKGRGVIFEYDVATNVYTVRKDFENLINPFLEITSLAQTHKALKRDQTITFTEIGPRKAGDPVFTLSATSSSLLAVEFTTTSDKVTLAGTSATPVKPGSVTINANQPGNVSFNPAPQVQRTFCINPVKPLISIAGEDTENVKLNSSSATGNKWFLNGTLISTATSSQLEVKGVGIYSLQIDIDGCVSEVSENFPIIITGDIDADIHGVVVYPNPVEDKLTIAIAGNKGSQISIFQLDGRRISNFSASESAIEVNVSGYTSGAYVVKIITDKSKEYVGKFVKK